MILLDGVRQRYTSRKKEISNQTYGASELPYGKLCRKSHLKT